MKADEIKQLEEALEAGLISEDDINFRQQLHTASDAFDFKNEGVIVLGAVLLGFASLGSIGAIALGLIASQTVLKKVQRGLKERKRLESDFAVASNPSKLPIVWDDDSYSLPSSPPPAPGGTPTTDVAEKLKNIKPVRSLFFIGASRTGKSILATETATRLKDTLGDNLALWAISAKCDPSESGYWRAFDRVSFFDFLEGDVSLTETAFNQWVQFLREFKQLRANVAVLVVDEISLIGGVASRSTPDSTAYQFWDSLKLYMLALSSAGASSSKAVWCISPTGQMSGLGLKRSDLGAFTPVFLGQLPDANPGWNELVFKGAKTNGLSPGDAPTSEDFTRAKSAECTVLTGIAGEWLPTQRYEVPKRCPDVERQFNQVSDAIAPHPIDSPKSIDTDTASKVQELKRRGYSQSDIIFAIWGAKPGGSKAYREAVEEFKKYG